MYREAGQGYYGPRLPFFFRGKRPVDGAVRYRQEKREGCGPFLLDQLGEQPMQS